MNKETSLNSLEAEFFEIAIKNEWALVYQKIGQQCQSYPYTCIEAKKPQNKPLNRYRDVNPYDHTRIILKRTANDYINANLVTMERAKRQYILTQGPLESTVSQFWLMVWEQNSRAILMLNKLMEKNEVKCHWYWPISVGLKTKVEYLDVNLAVEQTSETDNDYYSTRVFRITDLESMQSREVIQFHYTTWPDFGVPQSPVAFLDFLDKVRASGALDPDVGPPVVHCSAGIGRSGTFCLVDSCLVIIENEGTDSVKIQEVLLEMRKHRMGLIQTPDQLRFSYQAIIEGTKRLDPHYQREINNTMLDSIYSMVENELPPSPPPRGESLSRAPVRPLPALPCFNPDGQLTVPVESSSVSSSSPPTHNVPSSLSRNSSNQDFDTGDDTYNKDDSIEYEEYEPSYVESESSENGNTLRRRPQSKRLPTQMSGIKRRTTEETERCHTMKRSLYKPLTITFGFIIAGIIIYSYVKH